MKIASYHDYNEGRPVLLKLVTDHNANEVDLVAVDEHGHERQKGHLLSIRESGLYMHAGINPDVGLPLDGEQRLKVFNPNDHASIFEKIRGVLPGWKGAPDGYVIFGHDGKHLTIGDLRKLVGQ